MTDAKNKHGNEYNRKRTETLTEEPEDHAAKVQFLRYAHAECEQERCEDVAGI